MKPALIAGLVAAAVAAGSALATGSTAPAPRAAHAAPHHPQPQRSADRSHPLSSAAIGRMVAAWSAAHPGWKNPADMTHAEMLQAAIDHPEVYGPDLNRSSKTLRIIDQYGAWTTLPPQLRAAERAAGVPIPANLPYVPLSEIESARTLARVRAALAAMRR